MMKSTFKTCQIVLLMCGVFGAGEDEVKSVSVMEGDSVTLDPDKIQGIILILWRFGDTGPTIAQIDGNDISYPNHTDIFRDRLQLDQTGSLTINNMRTKHSGLYKLQIDYSGGTPLKQKFSVTVYDSPSVIDATEAEMNILSVIEGDPVTLPVPQLYGDELIVWRSGYEGKLIAKYDIEAKSPPLYNTDERFRDRLQLDDQIGSLIITNTRTADSGLYTGKISSNKQTLFRRFTVTVTVPEPPVSPGAVAGIVVVVVLLVAVAVGVFYYRSLITNLSSETLSMSLGDDVTLKPGTLIQTNDEIQWLFGVEDTLIAEIKKETRKMTLHDGPDVIFKNKLKLDKTTGSLIINCINTEHTGLYTLKIRRGRETLYKKFQVSVYVKYEAAIVGNSVHLLTGLNGIQKDDEIQWIFRDEEQETLIATIKGGIKRTYDGPDGIFKDRLELEKETGNLKIKVAEPKHAGCYKLKIRSSKRKTNKTYFVIIRGINNYADDMDVSKEETVECEKVIVGNPVHLLTDLTEIPKDDEMQWLFRDENQQTSTIATIKGGINKTYDGPDGIFKDSLELDTQTGNLKIKDSKFKHAGCYKVKIRSRKGDTNKIKTYFVIIGDDSIPYFEETYIVVEEEDTVECKAAIVRDSVRLPSGLAKIQTDDEIKWLLKDKRQVRLIAEIKGGISNICDGPDGIFKDSLELETQTGDLIIKNSKFIHAGCYKVKIRSSKGDTNKTYFVIIRDDEDLYVNVNENETGKPLRVGVDVVNEQEGTSLL